MPASPVRVAVIGTSFASSVQIPGFQRCAAVEVVAVASGLVQVVLAAGRPVIRRGEVLLVEATTIESWRNLGPSEATLFWILRD